MRVFIDNQSILATEGEATVMVSASDVAHAEVLAYLHSTAEPEFAVLAEMVTGRRERVGALIRDAEDVVDGDRDDSGEEGEAPYRIVHGDPVADAVLLAATRVGGGSETNAAAMAAFLRRLERNPSASARSQLFGWLRASRFTLTDTGLIVGYKGVASDGRSIHSGRERVTVTHADGTTETVVGKVPYPVGSTVTMSRALVDSDRDTACSVGLHVGTFEYASGWGDELLVVLFDPAHVGSVPSDSACQKVRVSQLYVAARHTADEPLAEPVLATIATGTDDEAAREFNDRDGNGPWVVPSVFDFEDEEDETGYANEDEDEDDEDETGYANEDEYTDDLFAAYLRGDADSF